MIDYVFYVEKYSKEFKVDSRVHFKVYGLLSNLIIY